ncbi:hypothetical protein [Sagittula stellata]|uniref:Lipoprotein n=1 Tax=Sagittula stellata (strain ATCC 700073 / DSM 11524 / E-37) TaxID=388399 RepID=A3K966_SAGS3|nr:hypothetical protein [Sagittula stellata]EBA06238.1 hypothetical protein SSE37_15186 [Sagittula stellata E-37]
MVRILAILSLMLGLAACTDATSDLSRPVEPLGDFTMGHAIVVAPKLNMVGISKEASREEWVTAVDRAVEKRFRRYDGGKFYHLGISLEEYSLAVPVPLVPSKSGLSLRVTVWDDAAKAKMNEETHVVRVVQVLPSYGMTREQQIASLSEEAALWIEKWLRERMKEDGWFATAGSATVTAAAPVQAGTPAALPEG